MREITSDQAANYQRTTLIAPRKGSGLPRNLVIVRQLGKGSNNTVYLAHDEDGNDYVVRDPRRNSDTQRIGNASWEFRNTAIASGLGVAPTLYDAWYARHATKLQRSGLHMICAYYEDDLQSLVYDSPDKLLKIGGEIRKQAVSHLRRMADETMLCYDVKPSNMVFNVEPLDVRFIDFGRDFCEWRPFDEENAFLERAPVLSYIQTLVVEASSTDSSVKVEQLYKDLIYATMLIMLSANIAYTVEDSRTDLKCSLARRSQLNFMACAALELREVTRGRDVKLIKKIMRHQEIRSTARHYMGRRNSGTKRMFRYANFVNYRTT